jgi:sugar phosphate isomerase/epimerase
VEYAESRGVTLAVESHGLFGTDLPALKAVIDAIPSDFLGITLDTSNFYQNGVNPLDAIAAFGKRIYHTHMKDGVFTPEYQPAALGEGALDFKAITAALHKAGYRGAYCLEYDGTEPYEGLKRGLANFRNIITNMG